MTVPKNEFSHLWNDLPFDERARLMPYMIESQIVHIWQCQQKAMRAHSALMAEYNEQIKYLESELKRI